MSERKCPLCGGEPWDEDGRVDSKRVSLVCADCSLPVKYWDKIETFRRDHLAFQAAVTHCLFVERNGGGIVVVQKQQGYVKPICYLESFDPTSAIEAAVREIKG